MPDDLIVRGASAADLEAIGEIYHHYVRHSTCTFETEPRSIETWHNWLTSHTGHHPAVVCERDRRVVGWGSLSAWNNRCAYRHTVENSVYVRADCHRQGIGRAILSHLLSVARANESNCMIAQIADHHAESEGLHRSLGFRRVGCLERVGRKFDRWIDVVIWQRLLGDESA